MTNAETVRALAQDALEELKASQIVVLDIREMTAVADYMIVASGTSGRHVRSIAGNVVEKAKAAGVRPLGVEGEDEGEWVLVDLVDVVVHVMQPGTRAFYDLERLWRITDPAQEG